MRRLLSFFRGPSFARLALGRIGLFLVPVLLAGRCHFASPLPQLPNRITQPVDTSQVQPLPNHHPLWASTRQQTSAWFRQTFL